MAREPFAKAADGMVHRDAFLYMDPTGDDFAQCGTCCLFRPGSEECAVVVGRIVAEGSCGLYANGVPDDRQPRRSDVSRIAAGYVVRLVRCENCEFFDVDASECGLYRDLNSALPKMFDLDPAVKAMGCCNAQTPMTGVAKSSTHSDLHVKPENAEPVHGIPVADVVTRANVQHVSWEMVREVADATERVSLPLKVLIATQQVVDRVRVAEHEAELLGGEPPVSNFAPLVLLFDGDHFIIGGHHRLQAAYNVGVKNVAVDLMTAPSF